MSPILQTSLHYLWFLYGLGFVIATLALVVTNRRSLVPTKSLPLVAGGLLTCGATLFITQLSWVFPGSPAPTQSITVLLVLCGLLFLEAPLHDIPKTRRGRRRLQVYAVAIPLLGICLYYQTNPAHMNGLHAFPTLGMFLVARSFWRVSQKLRLPSIALTTLAVGGAVLIPIAAIPQLTPLHPLASAILLIVPLAMVYLLAFSLWHIIAQSSQLQLHIRLSRTIALIGVSFVILVSAAIAGFLLTLNLENVARSHIDQSTTERAGVIAANFDKTFTAIDDCVKLLAASEGVRSAFYAPAIHSMEPTNTVLDHFSKIIGPSSIAYILDTCGTTIASSNRDSPESFVGKNYKIRPYFTEALAGNTGRYCAIGLTSQKRGYYSAQPVLDHQGKICAVAVVKFTLENPESIFEMRDPCMLVDPNGIVFASNRPDRLYKTIRPLTDSVRHAVMASHQYGTETLSRMPPTLHAEHPGMRAPFQAISPLKSIDKWTIVYEADTTMIALYRFVGLGASLFVVLVLVGISMIFGESNWLLKKLAVSEEQYRSVFEKSSAAMLILDMNTQIIEKANDAAAALLKKTDLVNKSLTDIVTLPPGFFFRPTGTEIQSVDIIGEKEKQARSTELHYVKANNAIHMILFDTTQRRKAEAALAASRQRLELALWSEGLSVWDWDIAANVVLFDSRWSDMLGYTTYADTDNDPMRLREIHAEDRATVAHLLDEIRVGTKETIRHRYRMKTAIGKVVWILNCGRVIERDFAGKPVRVVGIFNDITSQVDAEIHLSEMASRMSAILDTMPHLAWLKDTQGRYLTVNSRFAEAAGKSPEEIIGLSDYALWPFALADKYVRDDREVMSTQTRKYVEEPLHTPRGAHMFETFKSPIISPSGEVTGTAGVSRDITIRKAIEEASRSSSEHLQNLDHQIRTQLSSILGLSSLALRAETSEEMRVPLTAIEEAGTALLAFINERSPSERSSVEPPRPESIPRLTDTILIADDNLISLKLLSVQLQEAGATVLTAQNGREVLDTLKEHPETALIILDVVMPEMDGLETAARIRIAESDSDTHIPIIAITARALPGDRKHCISAGMDDYISKPFDAELLLERIHHWLDLKKNT